VTDLEESDQDRVLGRLRALLGPAGQVPGGITLLVIGLIDAVGSGLFLAGSALFFTLVVGLGAGQVGIGLSIAGLAGLVAQPIVGWLADRWTPRRMLVWINLWRAAGFTAYALTHDFATFVVVAALLGIAEQAVNPVYQVFAEQVVGAERRLAMMARVRTVYNIGFAVGALLATLAIAVGTRTAFLAIVLGNAASFLAAGVLLGRMRAIVPVTAPAAHGTAPRLRLRALRDGRYMAVAGVNGILFLHTALLTTGIPLWVVLHTRAPKALLGVLLVVNTTLAVLFQVRATRGAESVAGSVTVMRRAGVVLAACCAVFAVTAMLTFTPVVVAVVVLGIVALTAGELWQSAGGWALSYALAPTESRAEYLTTFNLGVSTQFVLGPTIVTLGVVNNGVVGWLALAGYFLLAALAVGPLAHRAARRPVLTARQA